MTKYERYNVRFARVLAVIAAGSYEELDNPVVSDFRFDKLMEYVEATKSEIVQVFDEVDFDKSTGMWFNGLNKKHPETDFLVAEGQRALEYNKKNHKDTVIHPPQINKILEQAYGVVTDY